MIALRNANGRRLPFQRSHVGIAAGCMLLVVFLAGCAETPSSPSTVLSAGRRVRGTGSGGPSCVGDDGAAYSTEATIQVIASGAMLAGTASAVHCPDAAGAIKPTSFEVQTNLAGSAGRFPSGFFWTLFSSPNAVIQEFWVATGSNQPLLAARGLTAPAAFAVTSDVGCASGERVEARLDMTFAHLGQTAVIVTHCVPAVP